MCDLVVSSQASLILLLAYRNQTGLVAIHSTHISKKVRSYLSYLNYSEQRYIAGSYWFNAMVPNGILINNTIINEKTQEFLDYVLDHQDSTGWLGPEVGTEKPRYLWGRCAHGSPPIYGTKGICARYPFFFGAIQMVEYKPELTDRVVTALHKFVKLANKMLRDGEGVDKWAATRWEDFVIVLQWYMTFQNSVITLTLYLYRLHDLHPRGEEELLVDTMTRLKWSGVPWEEVFSEEVCIILTRQKS